VGYAGGTTQDPTYFNLGNYTEAVQVDFDTSVLSYAKLLDIFWSTENSCAGSDSRQYMSAVFFHDGTQKKLAYETRAHEAKAKRARVSTAILPLTRFYAAEDYHQKYFLRQQDELMREFRAMYPHARDFMNSTAAARVNGYLGGSGSGTALRKDLPALGLSPEAGRRLLELCDHREP
jgi:methionine-S-sulfoxide reductase